MASRRESASWDYAHWAGGVEQFTEAARLAHKRLTELVQPPEDWSPDSGVSDRAAQRQYDRAMDARHVAIEVKESGGYSTDMSSVEDFASLATYQIGSVEAVTMYLGRSFGPSVTFRGGTNFSSALSVEVRGFDRHWVRGVRQELDEVLKPRCRVAPRFWNEAFGFLVWFVPPILVILVGAALRLAGEDGEGVVLAQIAIALVGFAAVGMLEYATGKQFQLLEPGQAPRYQQVRGRTVSVFGALVISIIASLAYAAIAQFAP